MAVFLVNFNRGKTITPSDTIDIDGNTASGNKNPKTTDALFIGGAGIVAAVFQDGTVCNFTVVAGEMVPLKLRRVNNTTTTATLMVGLYLQ